MITANDKLKCDTCGKIVSFKEMNKGTDASYAYIPDSDISFEENLFRCRKCTDRYGSIKPVQICNKTAYGIL